MNGLDFHYGTIKMITDAMGTMNLKPSVDVGHAGHRFDIIADAPDGRSVAVELKHWDAPTKEMLAKAERESELLMGKGQLDRAYVVIPGLPDAQQTDRVRNMTGLKKSLIDISDYKTKLTGTKPPVVKTFDIDDIKLIDIRESATEFGNYNLDEFFANLKINTGTALGGAALRDIFVAMPFAPAFEDTFFSAIEPAADESRAACNRVDVQYVSGQILDLIHEGIRKCDLIVADLSEGNANVTYELGYGHALGKKVIHISSTPADRLPFDLRQWQTIDYKLGQTHLLKKKLLEVIPKMLSAQPSAT